MSGKVKFPGLSCGIVLIPVEATQLYRGVHVELNLSHHALCPREVLWGYCHDLGLRHFLCEWGWMGDKALYPPVLWGVTSIVRITRVPWYPGHPPPTPSQHLNNRWRQVFPPPAGTTKQPHNNPEQPGGPQKHICWGLTKTKWWLNHSGEDTRKLSILECPVLFGAFFLTGGW